VLCSLHVNSHKYNCHKLEGTQRVHISAKYTIMLWCTRLHVNISTSLCTCAVDASPANDNDVIDNDGWCIFVRKRRFQWYIVRTEIFSTFHPRVEYISVKTVIRQIDLPTPRAAMTPQSTYRLRTDRIKHHSIFFMCIFYIVFTFTVYCQLFDCMVASVQIKYLYLYLYPPPFTPFTWRI